MFCNVVKNIQKSEEEVKREDTTILLHLFGKRGREALTYDDFMMFVSITNLFCDIC